VDVTSSFVLYNSMWRNLVLAVMCGVFSVGGLLLRMDFAHDKLLLAGFAMFGSEPFSLELQRSIEILESLLTRMGSMIFGHATA
jgi:hypothetical protein